MKVYYQGIMDYLDNEIKKTAEDRSQFALKVTLLQDVRDNINRIIKEEHQKFMDAQVKKEE